MKDTYTPNSASMVHAVGQAVLLNINTVIMHVSTVVQVAINTCIIISWILIPFLEFFGTTGNALTYAKTSLRTLA